MMEGVIAHIAGLPVEELIPLAGAVTVLWGAAALRARALLRRRVRSRAGTPR
jgi:hypothetical protein